MIYVDLLFYILYKFNFSKLEVNEDKYNLEECRDENLVVATVV